MQISLNYQGLISAKETPHLKLVLWHSSHSQSFTFTVLPNSLSGKISDWSLAEERGVTTVRMMTSTITNRPTTSSRCQSLIAYRHGGGQEDKQLLSFMALISIIPKLGAKDETS